MPVGEFIENNHPLVPSGYVSDWHNQVLAKNDLEPPTSFMEAVEQTESEFRSHLDITANWNDITAGRPMDFSKPPEVNVSKAQSLYPTVARNNLLNIDIRPTVFSGDLSYLLLFSLKNRKDPQVKTQLRN